MQTIQINVTRAYHYSKDELLDLFPNINPDNNEDFYNSALLLAKYDFKEEFHNGEISPNTDDFMFNIKNKQK